MIVRSWSGKVPLWKAEDFHGHLLATGIEDYRQQPGCFDMQLWRRDDEEWAIFTLVSTWRDMASIRAYAGDRPEQAVLYPGDEVFGLVPDLTVQHHELLTIAP